MKIRSTLTFLIFAASASMAEASSTVAAGPHAPAVEAAADAEMADYAAIRTVLGLYIEGGRQGKSQIMRPAFHPDAVMRGGPGDSTDGGPIQSLFDYIDSHPAAGSLNAQITKIETQNQVAYARIESSNWNGARFSDMFLLIKDKGSWKILTKIFHQHGEISPAP